MTSISFYTLGCRANQYETDKMAKEALGLGFELAPYPSKADIYVINTCTVTSNAAKKSRNAIRHSKKLNPNAKVIFAGCDAELESLSEADVILKNREKQNIATILQSLIPTSKQVSHPYSPTSMNRVRVNLMVEDGCENFCSYCIVPYVRGKVRSRPMDEVLAEAKEMVKAGVKEIVLTGINLGEFNTEPETTNIRHPELVSGSEYLRDRCRNKFGMTIKSQVPLLINKLSSLEGLLRIRLSSIEPMYITDELIKIIKDNLKVCHHLHIPLQSGDDGILKAMKRTYTAKGFRDLVLGIQKKIKDIAITTDIIVGFPGEDEKAFKNTCKLVDKLQFSRIHVFSYSDRPGTAACKLKNKVDPKVIAKRYQKLTVLRDKYMLKFHRKYKGKKMEVLVESIDKKTGMPEGLTSNYIRVFVCDAKYPLLGKTVMAKPQKILNDRVISMIR